LDLFIFYSGESSEDSFEAFHGKNGDTVKPEKMESWENLRIRLHNDAMKREYPEHDDLDFRTTQQVSMKKTLTNMGPGRRDIKVLGYHTNAWSQQVASRVVTKSPKETFVRFECENKKRWSISEWKDEKPKMTEYLTLLAKIFIGNLKSKKISRS
jgi:hypothetical protein